MATRTTMAATACAVAAATMLTACGSGSDDAKIRSSPTASASATSAGPTAAATTSAPVAGAPTFDYPSGIKVVVDADTTGDVTKDAVLRDQGYGVQALRLAIAKLDPKLPVLTKYLGETALEEWSQRIDQGKAAHRSFTGTVGFYDRKVTAVNGSTAGVTFCEDTTYSYNRDTKTGKVTKTQPSLDAFTFHSAQLRKAADGTWRMTTYNSQGSAQQCRR